MGAVASKANQVRPSEVRKKDSEVCLFQKWNWKMLVLESCLFLVRSILLKSENMIIDNSCEF